MSNFLFSKRVIVTVTIVVLVGMVISLCYQLLHDTPQKRKNRALDNSSIVKVEDYISDTICNTDTKVFLTFLFCNKETGCYFGNNEELEDIIPEISSSIKDGKTLLKKRANDSVVYFITDLDTLKVEFKVYAPNKALYEGIIVN